MDKSSEPAKLSGLSRVAQVETAVETSLADALRKVLTVALILLAVIAAAYFSPLRHLLDEPRLLAERIRGMGAWAVPGFTMLTALLVMLGVPRLALCALGGMVFGFWQGLLWSQLGTMLAYYAVFVIVRWSGGRLLGKYSSRMERYSGIVGGGGVSAVIIARQVPLHGMLINAMLALASIRHWHFLAGTMLGILPEGIPCVLVGSGLGMQGAMEMTAYLGGVLAALAVLWLLLRYHLKRRRTVLTVRSGDDSDCDVVVQAPQSESR